jgi:hypothetical protein
MAVAIAQRHGRLGRGASTRQASSPVTRPITSERCSPASFARIRRLLAIWRTR